MGSLDWALLVFRLQFMIFWIPSVFPSFIPVDNILIDCGGNVTLKLKDARSFLPDSPNSFLDFSPKSSIVVSNAEMGGGFSNLYQTARVFKETSTYAITTKQLGRHWVRLHFHPVVNPQFNLKSAKFSVKGNGIMLIREFSFAKLAQGQSHLLKEYVIEVGNSSSKSLVLTFSPWNNSVAFINGIEVISVPNALFSSSVAPVPSGPEVKIASDLAFETVSRINMGGPLLTPENDTLWRTWVSDKPFLVNPASARNVSVDPSSVKYLAGESTEIAPNWVYATAQEMADAYVGDQNFNISWMFKVDGGFSYFIRLHFCDIVSEALNNLVFNVYVNNQSAMNAFDLSSKTNKLAAAYFADFVTNVSTSSDRILIQVGPPNLRNSFPVNAILNGLEIMKIGNPDYGLDALRYSDYNSDSTPKTKKKLTTLAIVISLAVVSTLLILIAGAICLYFHLSKRSKNQPVVRLPLPNHVGNSETKVSAGSFASPAPSLSLGRVLAFAEICEATKNFDESLVIGVGGFGKVYKGVLENGEVVAVKRGNPRSQQGLVEFRTEIEMLSKLRHRHLVSLIGHCEELNEMILVYEFMAGGPLRKHLYGSDLAPLTWKQRLEICIGAAKGLHYLHTGAAESIIHRDVKTTNILLEKNLMAKVADFGLSKLGPTLDQTHVSTAVKGSFGYLDPEYFRRQQLTEKSDVYSFGVVLMEVLCARPAINPTLPREQVNLAEWAMNWQKKGHLEHIIDPNLLGSVNLDSLHKFGETAEKCLAEHGSDRPTMGDVLWNLEYALQLQEASAQSVADENSMNYIPDLPDWIPQVKSVDDDNAEIVSDQFSEAETTSAVFSQLMNPKGR